MRLKPSQNFFGMVSTAAPDTGSGADPAVISGRLYHNGVYDAAVAVTATDEAGTTGLTQLSGVIPGTGYADGDIVELVALATVEGVTAYTVVWAATILTVSAADNATAIAAVNTRIGAPGGASVSADIAAIISEVNSHPSLAEIEASTVLAKEATATTIAAYLDTEVAAIKAKTDLIPDTPAAVGSAMTLTGAYDAAKAAASQSSLDALLTTTLTESYAADGTAMTVAQALYMIWSLSQAGKSGTTLTTKRLDGVTTAMTFTLDSAVAPTTISRTS